MSKKKFKMSYELAMALILVALILIFGVLTGGTFLKPSVFVACTSDVAYLAVMAMPMTFVILTSGIDLSCTFLMASAAMVFDVVYKASGNLIIAAIVCLLFGFVAGSINGAVIALTPINPWLVTMSTMYIFQSITWFIGGAHSYSTGMALTDFGTAKIANIVPTQLIIVLIVYAVYWFVDKKTTVGRYIHAIGYNENAVNFSGISANKIKYWIYATSGVVGALAGMMFLGKSWQVNQTTGLNTNIEVIALVVLGGTSTAGGVGGVTGTLFAALIIGMLKKGLSLMGFSGDVYNFVLGAVLVASLITFAYLEKRKKMVSRKMAIENMNQ